MTSTIDALHLRQALGRDAWLPPEPFGPDGWRLVARDGLSSVIATVALADDGNDWIIHASRTGPVRVPTYEELVELHRAVWGDEGYSYQVQAPVSRHVNIHPHALHLWGRADGARVLPDFGRWGSI